MMLLSRAADDPLFGIEWAIAAYAVIFIAFFGYLGHLHLSYRRLRRRIEALDRAVSPPDQPRAD